MTDLFIVEWLTVTIGGALAGAYLMDRFADWWFSRKKVNV